MKGDGEEKNKQGRIYERGMGGKEGIRKDE